MHHMNAAPRQLGPAMLEGLGSASTSYREQSCSLTTSLLSCHLEPWLGAVQSLRFCSQLARK